MPFWETDPTDVQPTVTLVRWRILETTDRREWHCCGYCPENAEGRVSTAIQEFDRQARTAITRSGRLYRLEGPPGVDPDAEYVLQGWLTYGRVKDVTDVTERALECGMDSTGKEQQEPSDQ